MPDPILTHAPFAIIQAAASDGRKALLFLPAGRHQIQPFVDGQPAPVDVLIEPEAAEIMERQRVVQASAGKAPFFSPSHQSNQPWFTVEAFEWGTRADKTGREHTGVWAAGQFTEAGQKGVAIFPFFSPEFSIRDTAAPVRPIFNPHARPNMGGFVDAPAFQAMPPVTVQAAQAYPSAPAAVGAVADSNPSNQTNNQNSPMKKSWLLNQHPADGGGAAAPVVQAAAAPAVPAAPAAPAVVQASAAELAELNRLREEDKARREREADAFVVQCCANGLIPAKDEAAKAQWKKDFIANPDLGARLAKVQAAPVGRLVQAGKSSVEVVNEDVVRVVQAYNAAPDHVERAALWKHELRKRFKPEFDRIVQASSSFGTLAGDLVVQQSLDNLLYRFPEITRLSTNFSAEAASFNQNITTRTRTQRTAGSYSTDNGYVSGDKTDTDVQVVINAHKFDQVTLNVNTLGSTRRALFDEEEESMFYSVGKAIVDDLYALFTTTNYTNTPVTKSLVDFARDTVVDLKVALNNQKVFGGKRTLLLNSSYYGQLEKDLTVVSNLINPQAGQAIGTSKLPPIAEFDIFEAGNLPTTGNLTGFGFRADAVCMAARIPGDYVTALPGVPATGLVSVVTQPETGLSMQVVKYVDHQMGSATMRVALMYGVAKGRVAAGQILRSGA